MTDVMIMTSRYDITVHPAEVSQLLRSMSNKSSPLDYIPTSLLKSCGTTFSILILHLANLSSTQATFPSKFKLALISPLHKKTWFTKIRPCKFQTNIQSGYHRKNPRASSPFMFPPTFQNPSVFLHYSPLIASFILPRMPCSS